MSLLNHIALVLRQHGEFRATLSRLNGLSDAGLRQRGLARGDIARVAYQDAETRAAAYARQQDKAPALAGYVTVLAPAS